MMFDRKIAGGALLGVTVAIGSMVGASALRNSSDTASNVPGSRTLLTGADALAAGCQPLEAAVIQEISLRGERVLNSQCVTLSQPMTAAPSDGFSTMASSSLIPAAYQPQPAVLAAPVAPVVAPAPRRTRQAARTVDSGRTWKKTALIIGGSTAAGAGIGGLIGGKKGALIGSAIGGGGSTIYEAMKRR
jgi:hypothetical protein